MPFLNPSDKTPHIGCKIKGIELIVFLQYKM